MRVDVSNHRDVLTYHYDAVPSLRDDIEKSLQRMAPSGILSLTQLEGMLGLLQDGIMPGPDDLETIADVFCELIERRKGERTFHWRQDFQSDAMHLYDSNGTLLYAVSALQIASMGPARWKATREVIEADFRRKYNGQT